MNNYTAKDVCTRPNCLECQDSDYSPSETARACMEVVSKAHSTGAFTRFNNGQVQYECTVCRVFICVMEWLASAKYVEKVQRHREGCFVPNCFRAVVNEMPGPWFSFRCDMCKGSGGFTILGTTIIEDCLTCNGSGKNPIGEAR